MLKGMPNTKIETHCEFSKESLDYVRYTTTCPKEACKLVGMVPGTLHLPVEGAYRNIKVSLKTARQFIRETMRDRLGLVKSVTIRSHTDIYEFAVIDFN